MPVLRVLIIICYNNIMDISRDKAYELLTTYIKNDALLQHCIAVEAIMRHFALKYNEDSDYWGVVGLLHDLDWEMFPEQHCKKTAEILKAHGYDDAFIYSVQSHGWNICTEVEPKHIMEKVLYALDELSGLIVASALVRPSKSLMDLEVKSVKKKWKQASFAAGVDRDIVTQGLELLDMDLSEAIQESIIAMRSVATELNLA